MAVTARRDGGGICSISASGHTGYSEQGSDIVCAAASTLMQALLVGLQDVLGIDAEAESDPAAPRMAIAWNSGQEGSQVVAETIYRSLRAVADSYPDFVTVNEEEIQL